MSTPPALLGFFRQEATEYLDQLDQLLAGDERTPPDAATFLSHTRALRGSATMTRLGGLPEFTATLERLAAGLRDDDLRWDQRLHFTVRGALVELRALIARADHWTDADQRLARTHSVALAAVAAGYLGSAVVSTSPASPVIPISRLFPDDGAPGLVERNPDPPVTIADRFRTDIAAAADSIAREAATLAGGERGTQMLALSDAVRRALLGLGDVAESYGATSIATLAMRMARSPVERPAERVAIQAFAQLLMDRELGDSELAARVREAALTWPGTDALPTPIAATAITAPPVAPPSVAPPSLTATPVATTRTATPSIAPAPPPRPATELPIVPIDTLLYRGPAALARARVVRDALREAWQRGGGTAVDPVAASLLDELSDLLDLAATDPSAA
jgi:HPt (histidine-containing phosphotransfer) domain-containing protein